MLTKALRLYGKNDVRLEEFELPPINENEILAKIISDSLCMSTYKAVIQGADHKRVPQNVDTKPIILGHEFCGEIVEVGSRWKNQYKKGQRFAIQPALNYKGTIDAPGYSFPYIGGCATYVIIPSQVMELGCLLPYNADAFFYGSLAEPMSCIIGSFKEFFHTNPGIHQHEMGIRKGGRLAILAGAGPMGLGAISYALNCKNQPSLIVVTDIDEERLNKAKKLLPVEAAAEKGINLIYSNTSEFKHSDKKLLEYTCNKGFDDVLVMAPVREVVEIGNRILGRDGCMSFFAGPTKTDFEALINFYNIHYESTHFIGTVGGNSADMIESIEMVNKGLIDPSVMITHIGGLDASLNATLTLPHIPGGKKLIYTQISMKLTAISDFAEKGKSDSLFAQLSEIVEKNNGLWCQEAEKVLLANACKI